MNTEKGHSEDAAIAADDNFPPPVVRRVKTAAAVVLFLLSSNVSFGIIGEGSIILAGLEDYPFVSMPLARAVLVTLSCCIAIGLKILRKNSSLILLSATCPVFVGLLIRILVDPSMFYKYF